MPIQADNATPNTPSNTKRREFHLQRPHRILKRKVEQSATFLPSTPDLKAFDDHRSPISKASRPTPPSSICPHTPLKQSPKSPICTRTSDIIPFSCWTLRGKAPVNCSRFAPIRTIGRGKFSTVHKVRDLFPASVNSNSRSNSKPKPKPNSNQYYALKTWIDDIHGLRQRTQTTSQMLALDIPALQRNPYILRHLHFWQENSKFHLLTELCEQGTLEAVMEARTTPLPYNILQKYTWQLLNGLAALHQHGIVHGDLKPSNIFVSANGTLKIGDFGCSCSFRVAKAGLRTDIEGDSKYMAPESLSDSISVSSDLFSLGISLFELVTDELLPAHGPHWESLRSGNFSFHLNSDSPRTMTCIPKEYMAFIRLLMHPSADRRPSAVSLLGHALFSSLSASTVSSTDGNSNSISKRNINSNSNRKTPGRVLSPGSVDTTKSDSDAHVHALSRPVTSSIRTLDLV